MIVSSFQTQYGIRLSREVKDMPWQEFKQLLSGISPDTPLGRIVAIRSETDKEVLKHFTKEQNRIRSAWMERRAKSKTKEQTDVFLEQMKEIFMSMAGGDK